MWDGLCVPLFYSYHALALDSTALFSGSGADEAGSQVEAGSSGDPAKSVSGDSDVSGAQMFNP